MSTDPLLPLFTAEVQRKTHEGAMEIMFQPVTVLHIAGALQLARRHPQFPPLHDATVDRFLSAAREYFADCPTVLEVLRRGDDPTYDVQGTGP
jgi:hypothetical protein